MAKKKKKIKILEVDQWTHTGNIEELAIKNFDIKKVKGGDSETIRKIFGGHAVFLEVDEDERPSEGKVWYRITRGGRFKFYKENYDTSD
jgi:hypothetical protein